VDVFRVLIDTALKSDVLILGELHGTQEVPRLVLSSLNDLASVGYRGLALEIPRDERYAIERWATGQTTLLPEFFAHPFADGRGNRETLTLIQHAMQSDWSLLCFDQGPDQLARRWYDRDGWMAENLTAQWQHLCPTDKIVVICGNLHSRLILPLSQDAETSCWPSFAYQFQYVYPNKTISAIKIGFQRGTYFSTRRQRLHSFGLEWLQPLKEPILRASKDHSFELVLPQATAATFLTPPRQWTTPLTKRFFLP
jgi:hypothetical protein